MSKIRWLVMVLVLSLAGLAGPASSQWWGGCRDAIGTAVFDYPDYSLPDIAGATISGGRPVIFYNPNVVLSVSQSTRRFFYFHECAHHALGHVLSGQTIPYATEQEADCWAARTLVSSGSFTAADLRAVQADVSQVPGDWTHLPGPRRALNLVACLTGGGDESTDSRTCRIETEWEERITYVTQYLPQSVPCTHVACSPWGCGAVHTYDVITVRQQVPTTQRVPVQRTVCS